jgi:hypothetical protein
MLISTFALYNNIITYICTTVQVVTHSTVYRLKNKVRWKYHPPLFFKRVMKAQLIKTVHCTGPSKLCT